MPLQQTSWYCAAITAAESARLIATEVGLDGAFLPPNVRELRNVIRRAILLADGLSGLRRQLDLANPLIGKQNLTASALQQSGRK